MKKKQLASRIDLAGKKTYVKCMVLDSCIYRMIYNVYVRITHVLCTVNVRCTFCCVAKTTSTRYKQCANFFIHVYSLDVHIFTSTISHGLTG